MFGAGSFFSFLLEIGFPFLIINPFFEYYNTICKLIKQTMYILIFTLTRGTFAEEIVPS
jgi:hypothetical protein